MKKNLLYCISLVIMFSAKAQNVTWTGVTSSNYFTSTNWSPATNPAALLQTEVFYITANAPFDCVQSGGSSSNSAYRPARVNSATGGTFTVNGALYPGGIDSLNGTINMNAPGDFNCRGTAYIGRNSSATLNINGGGFSTKYVLNLANGTSGSTATANVKGAMYAGTDLNIANGTGLTAWLNVIGGSTTVLGTLYMGTGGHIFIDGIGLLKVAGDKRTQLLGYITDGRLTCTNTRELEVIYNATNNSTTASIKLIAGSMIHEYPDSVVISSGVITINVDKSSAHIQSYRYRGFELSNDMYSSWVTPTYNQPNRCVYSAKIDNAGIADISLKQTYLPGTDEGAFDIDLHFVINKGDSGVYTYIVWNHAATYPATHVDENRFVWKINQSQTEVICQDSARTWQMPNAYDYSKATSTGIAEIIKINTGVRAGQYDCKYEFSKEYWNVGTYGHASNVNKIGVWAVFGGYDYFNDGPTKQDLAAAAGIIHIHFGMDHYGGSNTPVAAGENWSKIFGPFLLYANYNPNGVTALWNDAKARADLEKSKWPYSWLVNEPAYPLAADRGSVSGSFIINDASKPSFTGANAMIGIANPDPGVNWQNDSRHYQYWVRSDADGNFSIPNIRPGTYNLYAFVTGEIKEFSKSNIVVTAGGNNNQGQLTWNILRDNGPIVWEIGIPDRKAQEFRHGDDYFLPYKFLDYSKDFTNPLVYNIGKSNWATDINYAHGGFLNYTDNTWSVWPWLINFNITSLPATGNVKLTLAFAGSESARMDIYLNDDPALLSRFYPGQGGGNALLREAIHAKYWDTALYIPVSKLRMGSNTLNLTQGRGTASSNHVMYDYISMEGNIQIALPVKLISFSATALNNHQVQLNWETAYELNSKRFDVERSRDGSIFNKISSVNAKGSTTTKNTYTINDSVPLEGVSFYRLKQVDADGKITYSEIRQITINLKNTLTVYPNPVHNNLIIRLPATLAVYTIEIFDAAGKLMLVKNNITTNQQSVDVSEYATGAYLLRVNDGSHVSVQKFTKE